MAASALPDRDIVLIVDDMPNNLNFLSTALDQAGFSALVALDGPMALEQLKLIRPHVILLDAVMPGMDGFELCRRIQADPALRDIPVIFMTALDDTEHVVRGFADGAVDYVVKPVRPAEVVARINGHLRRSRYAQQARRVLDWTDHAAVALDEGGQVLWLTEKAGGLLAGLSPATEVPENQLPAAVAEWTAETLAKGTEDTAIGVFAGAHGVVNARLMADAGSWGSLLLLVPDLREWPAQGNKDQLGLTQREAEVLTWVAYGKTNREIGQILGISPRTVNKHLDHIFMKLGVETRAAAAAVAVTRNRERNGGWPEAAPLG